MSISKLRLFDTHCHLDFSVFSENVDLHIKLAQKSGVEKLLVPAIGPSNWQRVAQLAESYPALYFSLGFHPYFLSQSSHSYIDQFEQALDNKHDKCLALGECGLDFAIDVDSKLQESMFEVQIELAKKTALPLIIHSRKAHNRVLQLLKKHHFNQGGILHAFSGSEQQARQFIDLGFKIGVGGIITYPRANKTRLAICALPIESLVLETDAPDMPLNGLQGKVNHPKYLPIIVQTLALLRGQSEQSIAEALWANSHSLLFSL
ncbi:TatD family hydrolase [Vibrio aestuarianus]|uniref:TatD family hydrolase n=1 Tax=Vibrio aestuarianus TaxID=28171 RepID=A0A9X4FCX6_9VIBR|nr:TatD family hydrolase [Vibrio aestuarianus]MDE1210884.1 TatD family hydrolase [Vibrio aestuarianus]MDE1239990.1 TatD family hydrolase [Vibrio aestuarianus]MDE1310299.1 TatD family hydrolase [Vibrio aestuarianus]MDE1327841.1 TatD family hydrolase [Vibrio aestuarianus]MDE1356437.1 TatD family hydrolase [Vibrio aestuarianus]